MLDSDVTEAIFQNSPITKGGNELIVSSIDEALGVIMDVDHRSYKQDIRSQVLGLHKYLKLNKIQIPQSRCLTFVVPLKTYISIPEKYNAATVILNQKKNGLTKSYGIVRIRNHEPTLSVGKAEIKMKLSYLVVTFTDDTVGGNKIDDIKDLAAQYRKAISYANNLIDSYKSTPGIHLHRLNNVSPLSQPDLTAIALYDLNKQRCIDIKSRLLTDHMVGDLAFAHDMDQQQIDFFRNLHALNEFKQTFSTKLISKMQSAYDSRCLGRFNEAVIIADNVIELTFRYFIYLLTLHEGKTEKEALQASRKQIKMEYLFKDLANKLKVSHGQLRKDIEYKKWENSCRNVRNRLGHRIDATDVDNDLSYRAVNSSVRLLERLCKIVEAKVPNLVQDTNLLTSATWLVDMIEESNK